MVDMRKYNAYLEALGLYKRAENVGGGHLDQARRAKEARLREWKQELAQARTQKNG